MNQCRYGYLRYMKAIMVALRGRGGVSGGKDTWHLRLELGDDLVSNAITSVQKDYLILEWNE